MGRTALLLTVIFLLVFCVKTSWGQEAPIPTATTPAPGEVTVPVTGSPSLAPSPAPTIGAPEQKEKPATKPAPPPSKQLPPPPVGGGRVDPISGFNLDLPPVAKATPSPTATTAFPTPTATVKVVKEVRESDLPKVIATLKGEGATYVGVYSDGRGHFQVKAYFNALRPEKTTPIPATPPSPPAEQPEQGISWLFALMGGAAIIVFLLSLVWMASQR